MSQLSECPSDTYIVVTQPGVHAEDYSDRYAASHLRRKVSGEDKRIRSTMSVMDVLGDMDAEKIVEVVGDKCGAALLRVDAASSSIPSRAPSYSFIMLMVTESWLLHYRRRPQASYSHRRFPLPPFQQGRTSLEAEGQRRLPILHP